MKPLLPVLLLAALASCALEIPSRQDVRATLRSCAAGSNAARAIQTVCTALYREAAQVSGAVSVIYPPAERLEEELARRGLSDADFLASLSSAAFARANIFSLDHLSTGTHITLDGRAHTVTCEASSSICRVDDLISGGANRIDVTYTGGKLYAMDGFLPF